MFMKVLQIWKLVLKLKKMMIQKENKADSMNLKLLQDSNISLQILLLEVQVDQLQHIIIFKFHHLSNVIIIIIIITL